VPPLVEEQWAETAPPVFWPDFNRRHLFEAIRDFQRRDRRFGRIPV